MCGITGIWNIDGKPVDRLLLKAMTNTLRHRGPDDEGYTLLNTETGDYMELAGNDTMQELKSKLENINALNFDYYYDLGFGHRRLSIIDLSPSAHQPMPNEDYSIWIVYNGEIYNYVELRKELEESGHVFRSKSDTEVIIHAYEEWGIDCLQKFNGMWAFAIWDSKRETLFCSRDRFGIKPFYYTFDKSKFIFASEIKALLKCNIKREPNDRIIYDYLAFGVQDHTDETFFTGIKQLRPASYLLLKKEGEVIIGKYWNLDVNNEIGGSCDPSVFYRILESSVKLRLRSDVPVGTCLSGGLDSSSIVCIANKFIDGKKLRTFSSCFNDERFDEREYIESVIGWTGAEKNYVFPKGEELIKEIYDLIYFQDEPFGSTSIYAQWCVMRKASEKVKVLLDGQGGDELLAGYLEYYASYFKTLISKRKYIKFVKELICFLISHPKEAYELLLKMRLRERRRSLLRQSFVEKYKNRKFKYAEELAKKLLNDITRDNLPALLHYEDRNSMAFSIEARVPFLDPRLVEYTAKLPLDKKLKNGVTKIILRKAMKGILPEKIRKRKDKMGFVTPEEIWMRTVLKDWVKKILTSNSFRERKYWDANKVLKEFEDVWAGKKRYTSDLWRIINLELWMRVFIDPKEGP